MHIYFKIALTTTAFSAFLVLNPRSSHPETYRWVDSEGVTHYTDQAPKLDNLRHDVRVEKNERRDDNSNHPSGNDQYKKTGQIFNSGFSPKAELSAKIRAYLSAATAAGIISASDALKITTDEEGEAVLEYAEDTSKPFDIFNVFGSPNPRYSSPDSTWNIYNNAWKNYDLETALNCVTPAKREKLREIFSVLKKQDVIELGKNVLSFEKSVSTNSRARYVITYKSNGDVLTTNIGFVNIFGNWKIVEF